MAGHAPRTAGDGARRRKGIPSQDVRLRYALAVLPILAAAACSASPAPAPVSARSCSAALVISPLPAWARSGFHPPGQARPHVMGVRGGIVAILWARRDALHAPPLANVANKILWVSRLAVQPGAPLTIRATLNGTSRTATRELPNGPGPSQVNLPAAGCWTLNLSWSGHRDRVELRYAQS